MAKVGFWLRGAKGKLAGSTIYKDGNGDTVMREIVSPANPQTDAQMVQRIIMHTIMSAYSKMKAITDHSFEGVKKGTATMAAFMSNNLNKARLKVSDMQAEGVNFFDMFNFAPLGVPGFTPNAYQVAMGSLPSIQSAYGVTTNANELSISGISANTYAGVIESLNLRRGDQLTFLMINQNSTTYGDCEFLFARVILDPTDAETGLPLPLDTPFIVSDAINAPSPRNEGEIKFAYYEAAHAISYYTRSTLPMAGCCIASRFDGSKWLRSTTTMVYRPGIGEVYSLGECLQFAKDGKSVYIPNDLYLNNAGEGGNGSSTDESGGVTLPVLSGVTFDGIQATVGTPLTVTKADAEDVDIVATFSAVGDAMGVILKKGDTQVGNDIDVNAQNIASGTVHITTQGLYTLYFYNEDGEERATGYSFNFVIEEELPGTGG